MRLETIQALLDDLATATSSASVLPDPSPPSGNGVAYQKFMGMYQDLLGGDSES